MKVKRLVSLALALAVVLSTLCGCGKQEQPDVNDPNEGNKTKDTLMHIRMSWTAEDANASASHARYR